MDRSSAKVFKIDEEPKSYEYWLTQSPQKRLEAIEFLRQQYHGAQSRLQRVYRITKLK
ncbi:MAG: toxin secretion, membrane fusion protein [Bacteroidetes bacterium]|nr:toxin secretion, membrane fusion protein [Bacteroidota bacterium]